MKVRSLELAGFKSFAKKTTLNFESSITAIVGPNGSGKSNVAEAFRWALGEQSLKSLRGKRGEDLIWNGSAAVPRSNRASVTITFDNTRRDIPLEFDEVSITREVHSDGVNDYLLNRSKVRLKDIVELLAGIGLGATGHHIISQGEADRILRASPREREQMIEEALSLTVYHLKITESQRKLEKTQENLRQVGALRKEIAPHLKFLGKQMEKLAERDSMRRELADLYRTYLSCEQSYIHSEHERIHQGERGPQAELAHINERIASLSSTLSYEGKNNPDDAALAEAKRSLAELRSQKEELMRRAGRLEGMIEVQREHSRQENDASSAPIPRSEVLALAQSLEACVTSGEKETDVYNIRLSLIKVRELVRGFLTRTASAADKAHAALEKAIKEKEKIDIDLGSLSERETKEAEKAQALERAIEEAGKALRDQERELFELKSKRSSVEALLASTRLAKEHLEFVEREFKNELAESRALLGREAHDYDAPTDDPNDRAAQDARKKRIERIKIKLEDLGAGGDEIAREFNEVGERDAFLAREIDDLTSTSAALDTLLGELHEKLDEEFKVGIAKINDAFQRYFAIMFGGGSASIRVISEKKKKRTNEEEDEETEENETGIEVEVNLPRKKIRGIHMLSGGERALTSIALLFAISQVNPPPFLVLDETDAALDEANSRRYGDMIEELSRVSQLIVITHNRETMSRAGVLYGVTMGADSSSKLLSIKFDEAVVVAK